MTSKNDPRIPVRQEYVMAEVSRERDELRAERAKWLDRSVQLTGELDRANAEVERLRAALEFVADDDNDPWQGIARVALDRDKCRS